MADKITCRTAEIGMDLRLERQQRQHAVDIGPHRPRPPRPPSPDRRRDPYRRCGRHQSAPARLGRSTSRATPILRGSQPVWAANTRSTGFVLHEEVEHGGEKLQRAGFRPDRGQAVAGRRDEPCHAALVGREEGQRVDGELFSFVLAEPCAFAGHGSHHRAIGPGLNFNDLGSCTLVICYRIVL